MEKKLLEKLLNMGIGTKTGDAGITSLASGKRISKADARIEAIGALDELVSHLGFTRSLILDQKIASIIKNIQEKLFTLGSELANSKTHKIGNNDLAYLDNLIKQHESKIKKQRGFIIPGDSAPSAAMDVARTICRRFERRMVALKNAGQFTNRFALAYINRLSNLLYIFARCL